MNQHQRSRIASVQRCCHVNRSNPHHWPGADASAGGSREPRSRPAGDPRW